MLMSAHVLAGIPAVDTLLPSALMAHEGTLVPKQLKASTLGRIVFYLVILFVPAREPAQSASQMGTAL